jgi:MFS family permease
MVGLVDLVIVIPVLSLVLLAVHVADKLDRRRVLMSAVTLGGLASLGLAYVSYYQVPIVAMFVCVFFLGVARAFQQPSKSSLLPQLVPRTIFSNAVTWNLSGFQLASVIGPAVGGWVLAISGYAYVVYLLQVAAAAQFVVLLSRIERTVNTEQHQAATLKSLGEGIGFVWNQKAVLGAMALDMFAVLLGGATAMLPVFAADILHVGRVGYGFLWSAPAAGALVMSLLLVHRRPMARAGLMLLWGVAGFGASIIVFGLSRSFALSLVALFFTGAFDCISVVVRHTLVQMLTPDRMRGRVSAISGMFISASNELGGFESGTLAKLTSPVFSVVAGGVGTLIVVATAAITVPQLRNYGSLDGREHAREDEPVGTHG